MRDWRNYVAKGEKLNCYMSSINEYEKEGLETNKNWKDESKLQNLCAEVEGKKMSWFKTLIQKSISKFDYYMQLKIIYSKIIMYS